jgi:hypothetical protein
VVVVKCVGREPKVLPSVLKEICGVRFGFLVKVFDSYDFEMGGFLEVLFKVSGYVGFIFIFVILPFD